MVVPDGNPREGLMAEQQIEIRAVSCDSLSILDELRVNITLFKPRIKS